MSCEHQVPDLMQRRRHVPRVARVKAVLGGAAVLGRERRGALVGRYGALVDEELPLDVG